MFFVFLWKLLFFYINNAIVYTYTKDYVPLQFTFFGKWKIALKFFAYSRCGDQPTAQRLSMQHPQHGSCHFHLQPCRKQPVSKQSHAWSGAETSSRKNESNLHQPVQHLSGTGRSSHLPKVITIPKQAEVRSLNNTQWASCYEVI